MFLLRDARRSDLASLMRLAEMLNTVNLPHDEAALKELLDVTAHSFSGAIADPLDRQYLFVAEDADKEEIVGTSMIIARHGTKDAPHLYFEVAEDQRYSTALDRHFYHTMLRLGQDFDGPTEIGGLVLDAAHRGGPRRLGKQLSYVRFMFIAMNRKWFGKRLLAELLPPLLPDGRSELWEHLGRHFTGLDYTEADHFSRDNKEFIISLFPREITAAILPEHVRAIIGQVGPHTQGVRKMLEDIGFTYSRRIDPFDGGPHFEADVDDVSLVQAARRVRVATDTHPSSESPTHLVGDFDSRTRHKFRAVACRPTLLDERHVMIGARAAEALRVAPKQLVWIMPLDAPEEGGRK